MNQADFIAAELQKLGLGPENSVVIGSGIMGALGLRESADIDLVVSEDALKRLKSTGLFSEKMAYGRPILCNELCEIDRYWHVLGKDYYYADLFADSIVMKDVRFISAAFLYRVKQDWIKRGTERPKDIRDVEILKDYLKTQTHGTDKEQCIV